MTIHINADLCMGCGACVDACPPQAICLVADKAVIRPDLCTACGDCVKVCAPGAITIAEPTALMRPAVSAPTTIQVVQQTSQAPGKIVLWTGIAATVIEQHILPRLADAFIAALERRLSRPRPVPASSAGKDIVQGHGGRGLMRRQRRRGDRSR
jgi:NAD-dependent dihydropyrimidine dehydrogenase PreA subunit